MDTLRRRIIGWEFNWTGSSFQAISLIGALDLIRYSACLIRSNKSRLV
jgi:hypothetical protein